MSSFKGKWILIKSAILKPSSFEIGDHWSLNESGEIVKNNQKLKHHQIKHKSLKVTTFVFDITHTNKHWNLSRIELQNL